MINIYLIEVLHVFQFLLIGNVVRRILRSGEVPHLILGTEQVVFQGAVSLPLDPRQPNLLHVYIQFRIPGASGSAIQQQVNGASSTRNNGNVTP